MVPVPMRVFLLLLLLPACSRVERSFEESFEEAGLFTVWGTVERGSFAYTGDSEELILVSGVSTGRGATRRQAEKREEGNEIVIEPEGEILEVTATSEYNRASVDVDVRGPDVMDLDVEVERGTVHLAEVEGTHLVTAGRVTSQALIGSVDLLALSGGMDVEVWPFEGGNVQIESTAGDAVLRLPYGGAYDVVVYGDPAYEMLIEELGWSESYAEPGFYSGRVGDGSILVTVYVTGGSFELLESR